MVPSGYMLVLDIFILLKSCSENKNYCMLVLKLLLYFLEISSSPNIIWYSRDLKPEKLLMNVIDFAIFCISVLLRGHVTRYCWI